MKVVPEIQHLVPNADESSEDEQAKVYELADHTVTIQSSGGLSKDDIEKMLKQAEQFKEEDKKRRQVVDLKNEAHSVYENTKRQLEEFRSKIPTDVA